MQIQTPNQTDRVRRHTGARVLQQIDQSTRTNVRRFAAEPPEGLNRRIEELKRKWDMERTLEFNAGMLALTGAVLGLAVDRRWFFLTGGVLAFLIQHASTGWCPPVPVFRRLGVRTQGEIDQERYALKALRGDFSNIAGGGAISDVLAAVAR